MTPRIVGFVSRADAKLRPPRSVSRNITPARGGAAVHYGGPAQRLRSHAQCIARWRAWQTYHMAAKPQGHGWADIAYTGGFCDHGYAFAGRGLGIRTAANGTNAGNQSFYAFTWLGGEGETPTAEALDALAWWVQQARDHEAGDAVRPHRSFKGTSCPGSHLVTTAARLDGKPLSGPAPASSPLSPAPKPTPKPEDEMRFIIYTAGGIDWGSDLVVRFPFDDQPGSPGQERKATWIGLVERQGGKVTRQELTPAEIEALIPIGVGL
jgi:hypothetical protein